MNKSNIRTTLLSLAATAIAAFGLTACDTGTEPGNVNVERSDIKDEGSMIGGEDGTTTLYSDTTDLEKYYDDADHENHDDNDNKVIGDGAYDGKGDGVQRDEVEVE